LPTIYRRFQLQALSCLKEKASVLRGDDSADPVDPGVIAKRLQRPIKDGFAGNHLILLGPRATRPGTAARRHDDCNHCHISPLTACKRGGKEVA
jgi:hypothetical protein